MKVVASLEFTKGPEIGVGEGRNSHVYMIKDAQLDGDLVLKEIPKRQLGDPAKFFNECKKVHASRHQNVVEVQYGCETPELVCIVMPHYPKGSLASRIMRGPLSVKGTVRVGVDLLNGLGAVHSAGIVHLDVKPTNVLFSDTEQALLADFGQSCWIDPATGFASTLPELYSFAVPPELYKTGVATSLSDIYQAGLTLYRTVNGNPHYQRQVDALRQDRTGRARDRSIRAGSFPSRDDFLPHVPQGLCNLIRDALALDPCDRPQSAIEFRDSLGRVAPEIDWSYERDDQTQRWTGMRETARALVVEHVEDATTAEIAVYTLDGAGGRRRKTDLCTTVDVARGDVELRRVFRALTG